ncbi:helix-turn-helix domain-containing protein [Blastococcus haudaquaticus]|uniref:AraC-type DNA-binding protein n=1 Tax=Blastococcus haudaquaticus TaxID=1938745 RepID=A0A286H171_9ACTN|nr:helix-turn-helix domain-containing protein [Blastococcus haudaquaticus]SOE01517.1 AraC-type DNA-binding protein [Blastococcus haudaquaticus]
MLLLDTAAVPRAERVDAFRAAMGEASVPCRIDHEDPSGGVRARMHLWEFGSANLFTADSTGFRLLRTSRHLRMEATPVVALAFQASGVGRFSQFDAESAVRDDSLMLSDLTGPYAFSWGGWGGSRAFQIPYEHLALPVDVVRRAGPRLRASPLHGLVRAHLQRLADRAEQLSLDPGAASLGRATTELVRALLVSAAGDVAIRPQVRAETLVSRVLVYAQQHLAEPDLTPERIARAHNVSVRLLYRSCAEAGLSLEQWIIGRRLEEARALLAAPAGRQRAIASVAQACGFSDPSHFARRFRAAFGLSPRDWQHLPR